jgi:hypothetical protein
MGWTDGPLNRVKAEEKKAVETPTNDEKDDESEGNDNDSKRGAVGADGLRPDDNDKGYEVPNLVDGGMWLCQSSTPTIMLHFIHLHIMVANNNGIMYANSP